MKLLKWPSTFFNRMAVEAKAEEVLTVFWDKYVKKAAWFYVPFAVVVVFLPSEYFISGWITLSVLLVSWLVFCHWVWLKAHRPKKLEGGA